LLVSLAANISYLTGFLSRDAYLLVSRKGNIYFTDSRYTEEAGGLLDRRFRLKKCDGSVFKQIAASSLEMGLKKLGFEERYLPVAEHARRSG